MPSPSAAPPDSAGAAGFAEAADAQFVDARRWGRSATARSAPPPPPPADTVDDPGDAESVARALCLRSLTAGPRTRHELADLLRRRGIPDDAAHAVLDRFSAVGLIDDAGLAVDFAATRQQDRGLSRRAIAHQLRQRGVAGDTVAAAVAELDPAVEEQKAQELVARKLRTMAQLDPQTQARRLVSMLARKGYPAALSYRVVRAAVSAVELPAD